jgi:hypothetical protein
MVAIPLKQMAGNFYFFSLFIEKTNNMRGILYIIAVILIIGWLLGVFVYSAKGLIHVLIVLAIISLILGVIRRS